MAITKIIDPIPPAPTRSNPENFDERADAFLKRIETLDEDLNEWAEQCNQTQQEINEAKDIAVQAKNDAQTVLNYLASEYHYRGEWDANTTYNTGDSISYNGYVYLSKQDNNINKQPDTNPDWWLKISISESDIQQGIERWYDDTLSWEILDIQTKLAALTLDPVPYGIPYLDENGYIDKFVSSNFLVQQFSNVSDFIFSANTVYQAQYNAVIYTVIGGSDVTLTYGANNPPDKTLTLKANNTICLFIPKGFYVQFSADTTAQILSKEVSNVFV